ncbi:MAG TPA: hypothetical protein VJZ24_03840 [Thermodesulfovibrionales bacterium]|nr:hypothetical protein [Thermodesulfovibrionales bacterium]
MKSVKEIKKVQVGGKKHFMPAEDAEIEKLLQRGLSLKEKVDGIKREMESIQNRLIDIAKVRREGTTTVTLEGVTAHAIVTFRESYVVKNEVEDIKVSLGPLFERFFERKIEYKTTLDFKKFMESGHALGLEDPVEIKKNIMKYVSTKETKPNVKMEEK